jgi:hypothetical protein
MRCAKNRYHSAIRRAKREHWREYISELPRGNIWQAAKYALDPSPSSSSSRIPNLTAPDGSIAMMPADKAKVLHEKFFPPNLTSTLRILTSPSPSRTPRRRSPSTTSTAPLLSWRRGRLRDRQASRTSRSSWLGRSLPPVYSRFSRQGSAPEDLAELPDGDPVEAREERLHRARRAPPHH